MGNRSSVTLSAEQVQTYTKNTGFNEIQVHNLYKRFQQINKAGNGKITVSEFMAIPEFAMNPLAPRIIELFDDSSSDDENSEEGATVDFDRFLHTLAALGPTYNEESKIRFAFRLYDVDNDGYISHEDLFAILKLMVGQYLQDDVLHKIVETRIAAADVIDKDGKISFSEFKENVKDSDLSSNLTITFK
eukprot:Colp12_sorted_trinity150504_noHs@36357